MNLGHQDWLDWKTKADQWGVNVISVYGCHPRYIKVGNYNNYNDGTIDAYVASKDQAKARYHYEYGYPADIDVVIRNRNNGN